MNLRQFEGKSVRLTDDEGEVYEGYAADYIFAEDNEPEEIEALVLDNLVRKSDGHRYDDPVEFTAAEIKFIEAID